MLSKGLISYHFLGSKGSIFWAHSLERLKHIFLRYDKLLSNSKKFSLISDSVINLNCLWVNVVTSGNAPSANALELLNAFLIVLVIITKVSDSKHKFCNERIKMLISTDCNLSGHSVTGMFVRANCKAKR